MCYERFTFRDIEKFATLGEGGSFRIVQGLSKAHRRQALRLVCFFVPHVFQFSEYRASRQAELSRN